MAMYAVDSNEVAAAASRLGAMSADIRAQVNALMSDLLALEGSWTGAAQVNFRACVDQWRATQVRVDSALDAIGVQMSTAAEVYAEAEARSAALFAG